MSKRAIRKSTRVPVVEHHRPFLRVQRGNARNEGSAQFMWRYRKHLHALGCVDFELPWGSPLPAWMAIVFEQLRSHPRHWKVGEYARAGGITYRVFWKWWLKNGRRGC